MAAPELDVIRWGAESARTGRWRGDERIAYLAPAPDGPPTSAAFARRCCSLLAARGFEQIVTAALNPTEQAGFLGAGFEVRERLHVLSHDLRDLERHMPLSLPAGRGALATVSGGPFGRALGAPAAPVALRRARPTDRAGVLALDSLAFPPFWRLDDAGLDEALGATPQVRFRVAGDVELVGYAITGRSGRRGFLQRLAVHPARRRQGIARALVLDGMRWLRRWRTERAVVNTQLDNDVALALYESLGFRREPFGLAVLGIDLRR